ncbi:MAG TPA: prepilin-type N-terminal cleavage/methylation domain-containing protein [Verrucomicrobiae bacterium]|nr:prepilin-type N-terminal cleavage/methylation domain-containing protein [Verrucomicrobiae bacterium]
MSASLFIEPCRWPRSFRGSRRGAGFSLIEVVVAILILGIALVGLTEGITTALSSSKASEVQTTAALLAAGQIESLRAEGDFTDGETDGDFGDAFPLYQWKQTLSAAGINGLHDVDVVVQNSQTGQTIYELKTMLFAVPQGTNAVNLAAAGGSRLLAERRQP